MYEAFQISKRIKKNVQLESRSCLFKINCIGDLKYNLRSFEMYKSMWLDVNPLLFHKINSYGHAIFLANTQEENACILLFFHYTLLLEFVPQISLPLLATKRFVQNYQLSC